MKVVKASKIIKMLIADGWYFVCQKGSHQQYKHPTKTGKVTVNLTGNADVTGNDLKSIERQSGLTF